MRVLKRNPILRVLSSLKFSLALLAIFAVAIARATFIESSGGAIAAKALVYNARWFEIVLALLVVNLILALGRWFPWRPRQTGFVIIHVAMIVILVGAGITRFFGFEGTMAIREGAASDWMYSRENHVQLRFDGETASYPVRLFAPGPQSVSRTVELGGRSFDLAVEEYWPRYDESFREGEGGRPALSLTLAGGGESRRTALFRGEETSVGELGVWYVQREMADLADAHPLGRVLVRIGGQAAYLPVTADEPEAVELAGHTIAVIEFQSDFRVGADPEGEMRMTNPMVRVWLNGPDGESEERMLFAFHPDFSMQHQGGGSTLRGVDLRYEYQRRIMMTDGQEGVIGFATMPVIVRAMGAGEAIEVLPGTEFPVAENALVQTMDGTYSVLLQERLASAVQVPVLSDNPNAPPAARIRVTDDAGNTASAIAIRLDSRGGMIDLGGRRASVMYGPVVIPLPYSLRLDDFVLATYPGSDNPASYESHVRLSDPELGIDGRPERIYMNHPLTHRGYKHFQSSYDQDRRGTVLTVNYDPGKLPTYVGYALITVGLLLALVKKQIWRHRLDEPEAGEGGAA